LNHAYIAKNICEKRNNASSSCHGKCYLKKKLARNEQNDKKLPDLRKLKLNLISRKTSTANRFMPLENKLFVSGPDPGNEYSGDFSTLPFHPPEV
jgi:hypothetical protein